MDGLPDAWEREQRALGLSAERANLILVPVIRASMTRAEVQPTLDRIVDFFARVPIRNRDGSTGIGVVVRWGNVLADFEGDARERGIPAELIGKAHGVAIGPETAGGGQTPGPDWSYAANHPWTIVHELGHQLGLQHEPRGTGIPSPLYASIMNYEYTYQFNGDADAVRFSPGTFASLRLDENALDETLPFAVSQLEFLSRAPNFYPVRSAGRATTQVDFDRDGVFGERGVRADINSGYAVFLSPASAVTVGRTAGGFVLAPLGDLLVAVYSHAPGADYLAWAGAGLSPANPGILKYRIYDGRALGEEHTLMDRPAVTGDPHAAEAFGALFVVFPTRVGYSLAALRPDGAGGGRVEQEAAAVELAAPGSHPVLVRTSSPEQLHLFIWDERSRAVRHRLVNVTIVDGRVASISLGPVSNVGVPEGGSFARLSVLPSNSPVGAVWNSRRERIALVTSAESRYANELGWRYDTDYRMKLHTLGRLGDGWVSLTAQWLTGDNVDWAGTTARPTILFDARPLNGEYLVYFRRDVSFPTGVAWTDMVRLDPGTRVGPEPDAPFRWTKRLMGNEWVVTRSAPGAAFYREDAAFGWRLNETGFAEDVRNMLIVHLRSSGIAESNITDFDDVTYIAAHGLRESLAAVRP